jgi:hypothetical protein
MFSKIILTLPIRRFCTYCVFSKRLCSIFSGGYGGTGRKPYQYKPFIRSAIAKSFFKTDTNTELLGRLRIDSNVQLFCGLDTVPGKSSFSRNISELSETTVMNETLDRTMEDVHEATVVYQVIRDVMAIEAREKVEKDAKKRKRVRRSDAGGRKRGRTG